MPKGTRGLLNIGRLWLLFSLCCGTAFGQGKISHIIVIMQENRTMDNYFGQLPGVDGYPVMSGQYTGIDSNHTTSACPTPSVCVGGSNAGNPCNASLLSASSQTTQSLCPSGYCSECTIGFRRLDPTKPDVGEHHTHSDSVFDIDARVQGPGSTGHMDGFVYNLDPNCPVPCMYAYYGPDDIPFYYLMAQTYGIADHNFSSESGASFSNHLYLIAGQSNELASNPNVGGEGVNGDNNTWTCYSSTAGGVLPTGGSCSGGTRRGLPCAVGTDCPGSGGGTCSGSNIPVVYQTPDGTTDSGASPITIDVSLSGKPGNTYQKGVCGGSCSGGSNNGAYCLNSSYCTGGGACSMSGITTGVSCASNADCTANDPDPGATCQQMLCVGGTLGCLCPVVTTIFDELLSAGVTYKWYGPEIGDPGYQFVAPAYVQSIFSTQANSTASHAQFFSDVAGGTLPQVVYVSPSKEKSEHPSSDPKQTVAAGEAWTEKIIEAIFNSQYYSSTLIFLTWDDFGAWYDHVPPPWVDNLGLGMRTPLLCIGPYCKNEVNHTQFEFASILRCIEDKFISTNTYLTARDRNATSACNSAPTSMVNLSQTPIPPPALPAIRRLAKAEKLPGAGPDDVVSGVQWLMAHMHPKRNHRSEEHDLPVLAWNRCLPGYKPERAIYKRTGTPIDVCVEGGKLNGNILLPGQPEGDDEREEAASSRR